ncbi:MAG TPA: type II toxin-antitoxin system mRNA interferase toxin, RelE/StbE family [Phycisphaerae bacterium]
MSYILLRSTAFARAAKKFIKRTPAAAADLETALYQLEQNPSHISLKTHRLKGNLKGSWACSAGYDLRIIFKIVRHEGKEAILLQSIGTHDEVY